MTYLRVCCKKEWALEVMEQSELQAVCRIPNMLKTYPRYFQIFPTYYLKDISKTYSWIIKKAEYKQGVFWLISKCSFCVLGFKNTGPPNFWFRKKLLFYRKKKSFPNLHSSAPFTIFNCKQLFRLGLCLVCLCFGNKY